jgi:hypothetical protein
MRTPITAFLLGFLACAFTVLIILNGIEIPEYTVIYQIEHRECSRDVFI